VRDGRPGPGSSFLLYQLNWSARQGDACMGKLSSTFGASRQRDGRRPVIRAVQNGDETCHTYAFSMPSSVRVAWSAA
jgi:hypothetical protein